MKHTSESISTVHLRVSQFTTKLNKAIVFTEKVFSKKLHAIQSIETQCPYFLGIQESEK